MAEYAIIEMGGSQFKVEKGQSIVVDRLSAQVGDTVEPKVLFYRGKAGTLVDSDEIATVGVRAVVSEHLRGEKIRIFKYKPKKRYRKRAGHRQELTKIEIAEIAVK